MGRTGARWCLLRRGRVCRPQPQPAHPRRATRRDRCSPCRRHADKEATMSDMYHDGNRQLQDRFDTRRLADRLKERIVRDYLDDNDVAFITRMDMFFLATADA